MENKKLFEFIFNYSDHAGLVKNELVKPLEEDNQDKLFEKIYFECNLKPLFEKIFREAGPNAVQPVPKIHQIPSKLPPRNQEQNNQTNQGNHNEEADPEQNQDQKEWLTYDETGKEIIHYPPGKTYN